MTWISLVCVLALSSSAFSAPAYGGYSSSLPQMPSFVQTVRDQTVQRPFLQSLHIATQPQMQSGYGQQQVIPQQEQQKTIQSSYGSSYGTQELPKALDQVATQGYGSFSRIPQFEQQIQVQPQSYGQVNQGYGSVSRAPQFDQQIQVQPQVQPLTEADILCRGQVAETVIPIEDGRKFVVCLDESKGVEQSCPKGLWYHQPSRRCERKLGPLENQCASQPCLNGGQCAPTEFSYQCQCAPGFDGKTCELDARVCQQQQPCGQSPDSRCQSFRWGAALQHICILQDGLAYGLSAQQAQQNPCTGVDGPQALAGSNKGFIMCDGERMFVESCPGGTIWDDLNKACVWPDMQGVIAAPQFDEQQQQQQQQSGYGQQSSYGQAPKIPHHSRSMIHKPKHHMRHQHDQSKLVQQYGQAPTQSYGAQIVQRPQLERPQLDLGLIQQQSGYGAPQQDLTQQSGYGAQTIVQRPQQDLTQQSGYGAQTIVQRPQQDLPIFPQHHQQQQGYGAQTTVQRPQFDLNLLQPQQSSYGSAQVQKPINWQQPQQDIVQVKQSSGY